VISYVPEPLVPNIKKYADPSVSSVTALMDGNAATADVNMSENLYPKPGYAAAVAGDWRTYLFSSLGRGGKGIFALDVTDTGSLSQGAASTIFKWQFTSADDADLGFVIADGGVNPDTGQAAGVVRMPNGKFAYIAGNGVDSATGKAVLYILYVQGPTPLPNNNYSWTNRYHKIVLDNGTGNGLMQPFWLDSDDDGVVDTIYAGDLKGNMWKVNVRSSDPTQWAVAYNKPLYSAKAVDGTTPLPITSAPAVAFHPGGGVVVVFGTGKSIFSNDFPNNALQQRVYGIWDKRGYQTTPGDIPSGITELQQRVWTIESGTNDPVQTNLTAIDWSSKKGWFVNIPYTSGMVIHNMLFAQDGSTEIGIPIIYPTANIITSDACTTSVYGTYAQVDAITGIQPSSTFGAGKVGQSTPDQNFTIVRRQSGSELSQAIVGPTTLIQTASRTRETSRLYWREVPGIKTFVAPDTDKQ
jgi:type IV pilus assembly protein PilY1